MLAMHILAQLGICKVGEFRMSQLVRVSLACEAFKIVCLAEDRNSFAMTCLVFFPGIAGARFVSALLGLICDDAQ